MVTPKELKSSERKTKEESDPLLTKQEGKGGGAWIVLPMPRM